MATEATTGQPANVQAYLNKHSISTLFEDLTSLLVKELPDNPLDFLILKLQARKKKVTGTTSRSVAGPKKLDVTGTTAPKTERGKPAARPSSVKSSSTTAKPTRPTSSSSSSRPTTTKPTGKPTTGTATKERSTGIKSATTTAKVTKPTGVKPPTATTTSTGIKRPTSSTTTTKPSITKAGSTTPRKPVKSGTTGIPTKGGATPTKGGTTPTKGATPTKLRTPSDSPAVTRKANKPLTTVTEPPPPSSPTQESPKLTNTKKEVEEEEEKEVSNKVVAYNDSEEEEEEENKQKEQKDAPVELNQLISQLKRSKNPHKQDKSHLTALINARQSGISEGYISDNEEEEGDDNEQLEVAENIDALKEEGVVLTGEAKKISLKAPTVGPNVDLQVLICARCAKILSRDEETITVSSSVLNSIDDFESASQVTSSQTSYPQWDTDESGSMTAKQKWAATAGPVNDGASSSVSSHDTWKGLAPVSRHAEDPSDQESELQLPQPVDYHKPEEDTTEKEESSLIED